MKISFGYHFVFSNSIVQINSNYVAMALEKKARPKDPALATLLGKSYDQ
jgi:hypothetical protein